MLSKFESPPLRFDITGESPHFPESVHCLCTYASLVARKPKLRRLFIERRQEPFGLLSDPLTRDSEQREVCSPARGALGREPQHCRDCGRPLGRHLDSR